MIDLSVLLAPLSRYDLELLIVEFIGSHPEFYPRLLQLTHRPINTTTLTSSLSSLLSFSSTPSSVTPDLEPYLDQSNDYVKAGDVHNALKILDVLTALVVKWVKELRRGKEEETDEEYKQLESWFGLLMLSYSRRIEISTTPLTMIRNLHCSPLLSSQLLILCLLLSLSVRRVVGRRSLSPVLLQMRAVHHRLPPPIQLAYLVRS